MRIKSLKQKKRELKRLLKNQLSKLRHVDIHRHWLWQEIMDGHHLIFLSIANYFATMDPIEAALAALKLENESNIRGTAKKFGLVESTLRRRYKSRTVSFSRARYLINNRLSQPQKQALISQINRLTDRDIPPTTRMIRNFVEEIVRGPVDKNWARDFVRRYRTKLKSIYLQFETWTLLKQTDRANAKNPDVFRHHFKRWKEASSDWCSYKRRYPGFWWKELVRKVPYYISSGGSYGLSSR